MTEFLIALALLGVVAWLVSRVVERVVVYDYQHALLHQNGKLSGTLEPGVYWIMTLKSRISTLDARRQVLTVPGQALVTKDGVSLKLSVLVDYTVQDPEVALTKHSSFVESLYALVQQELRKLVSEASIEDIIERRNELSLKLAVIVRGRVQELGLVAHDLSIKDVMFPSTLKEAFSQLARAKQEAQAGLERARGESAALRNLANAADLMKTKPELYKLRVLQSLQDANSVSIRLGNEED